MIYNKNKHNSFFVYPVILNVFFLGGINALNNICLFRNLLNKCGKQNTGLVRLIFKEEEGLQGKLGLYCLRDRIYIYAQCTYIQYIYAQCTCIQYICIMFIHTNQGTDPRSAKYQPKTVKKRTQFLLLKHI